MAGNEYLICSTNPDAREAVWGDQAACDSARRYGTGVVFIVRNTKGDDEYCDLMVAETTGGKDAYTGLARVSPDDLANALSSFTQYPEFCWTDHYINPRTGIIRTIARDEEPHLNEVYIVNDGHGDLLQATLIARNVLKFLASTDVKIASRRLRGRFATAGSDGGGAATLNSQDNSPKPALTP